MSIVPSLEPLSATITSKPPDGRCACLRAVSCSPSVAAPLRTGITTDRPTSASVLGRASGSRDGWAFEVTNPSCQSRRGRGDELARKRTTAGSQRFDHAEPEGSSYTARGHMTGNSAYLSHERAHPLHGSHAHLQFFCNPSEGTPVDRRIRRACCRGWWFNGRDARDRGAVRRTGC